MNTARTPKGVSVEGHTASRSSPAAGLELVDPDQPGPASPERSGWPAVQYESYPWTPDPNPSQTMRRRASGSYQAALVPEIADLTVSLPPDVVTLVADASSEIARFDAEIGHEIIPYATVLLRSESAASSQIEELTAGAKSIALAEIGEFKRGSNAAVIASNTTTMTLALQVEKLDAEAIIAMHAVLLESSHPEWTGHWRDRQVWIDGRSPHGAAFVPPHADRVPAAMDDLVRFMARHDLSPLVQAAVAHGQFETIHPFPDGNGRVGRALIHSILHLNGLAQRGTVPVSAGLLTEVNHYFRTLEAYRDGNPYRLVAEVAEASFGAIDNGRQLVEDLRSIESDWQKTIKARSDSAAWSLTKMVLRHPAIDSAMVQTELGIRQQVADRAIKTLVDAGVLHLVSGVARNRRWVATDITDAMDRFAERAGRRQVGR
jgi:Fic family protein